MKAITMGLIFLAISVGSGPSKVATLSGQGRIDAAPKWEYRVLSKEEVKDLGKKDLAAGLNKLGDEGWELAAVDGAYIFKRSREQNLRQVEDIKSQIAFIQTDVELLQDRVAWAERMFKKGFLSGSQLQAERASLKKAEIALDRARRELKILPADRIEPVEKERKPEK